MTRLTIDRRTLLSGAAGASLTIFSPAVLRAQSKPTKVGVILPTSGVLAFPGQQTRKGTEFGVKVFNERGAPPAEFIYADTESKPENGRVAAERLIREGCTILIGAWDSGATISAAQAAEAAKIPLIVNIGSAPQITEQGFTQVFRNFTPGTILVANAVARIKELGETTGVQPKTAVLMHANDTFGQGIVSGVDIVWEKLKVPIKIVERIPYDVRARDLSVEVAKAKATGADLLLPITRVNDAILIVRELVKQNWSPMGVIGPGSPGAYEKAFTDALGKYADGYMVSVPWYDPSKDITKAMVARFERETNDRFELNVGFAIEGVQIALDAIRRAGSSDPAALHAALKATNITDHPMLGGPITFDEKGQNMNIGVAMLQNQGGKPIVVGPASVAQAKAVFPLQPYDKR
jgi:branched-chain amino acid transport system substrate-binding protein